MLSIWNFDEAEETQPLELTEEIVDVLKADE